MKTNFFKNKKILITGGTGSFGSTFLKYILKDKISEVRIFSRDEKKQEDLRNLIKNDKVKFYIGDTRSFESIDEACKGVDLIFHAAALKQVPSCEFYPLEAINTNIIGTKNVINAAIKNNVKRMVLLSTDKAVYPINAMGMSKALAEKVLIAKSKTLEKNTTLLCVTRYGNVMNSRGSVIPKFVQQIMLNKDITITDPDMTRYIMSLEESVKLVKYAMVNCRQGDIFVQKSPATSIINLANSLNKLLKKKSNIKVIGIRHGEKKHETLVSSEEMTRTSSEGNFFRISSDNRGLNYEKYFNKGNKRNNLKREYNSSNTKQLKMFELIKILNKIGYSDTNV